MTKKEFKKNIIWGDKVIKEWGVSYHELSYIILKQNLSILDPAKLFTRQRRYDFDYFKLDSEQLIETIQESPRLLRYRAFWKPEIQKATDYVSLLPRKTCEPYDYNSGIRFSRVAEDSQPFKKDKTETQPQQAQDEPYSGLKNIIEEHEGNLKNYSNVFSLIGKVWFVKFKNQEWGLYPDHEKYKYIAYVLDSTKSVPGKLGYSVYNLDLKGKVKGKSVSSENYDTVLKEDLNVSDLGTDLTPEEYRRFKDIGYELLEELNEAKQSDDPVKEKEAEEDFKKYQSHILNEYGIKSQISKDGLKIYFGTYYRSSKDSEKLRQSIKNQINNAIKDFKESMPTLSIHLRNSLKIKLDRTLYSPEHRAHWQIAI